MFTLKFIGHNNDVLNISCPKYEIYHRGVPFALVTVYRDLSGEGIEYRLDVKAAPPSSPKHWQTLFVTNESGKTIDTIKLDRNQVEPADNVI